MRQERLRVIGIYSAVAVNVANDSDLLFDRNGVVIVLNGVKVASGFYGSRIAELFVERELPVRINVAVNTDAVSRIFG